MKKKKIIALIVFLSVLMGVIGTDYLFHQQNNKETVKEVEQVNNMIFIKGGTFTMGSAENEAWRGEDEIQHQVSISDFYMSPYEVTQEEYQEVMGENPSTFSGNDLPVENVTWYDAIDYCNKRSELEGLTPVYIVSDGKVSWNRSADGYRLPTEAEWEYAARAGTTTPFNTETSISAQEANYYGHYPYQIEENYFSQDELDTQPGEYRETTIPVGSFKANQWGLYDMHGNVEEWCFDYYGAYDISQQQDPAGPSTGTFKVARGGGWNDFAKHLRSAYRTSFVPEHSASNIGFRVVRNATSFQDTIDSETIKNEITSHEKCLIVYFSWGGNTRNIAQVIQEKTNADIFEIELEEPYSSDYNTVLQQAQHDQNIQARPKIANEVENIDQYDTIILGYPNWWASIPMPIASFLESYDLSGKTIIPFCSHGGGRFGQSLTAIAKLAPDSVIGEGLSVHYSGGSTLSQDIDEWLEKNNIEVQQR